MQLEPVRKAALLEATVADRPDHCRNRGRGNRGNRVNRVNRNRNRNRDRDRDRNRDRSVLNGTHGPLKLRCRVASSAQQRFPVSYVRIPSRVCSIPIPIATPTPILLCHWPFRTTFNLSRRVGRSRTSTSRSGSAETVYLKRSSQRQGAEHETYPPRQAGRNATAPSAGGSPDPNGKLSSGKRLPIRTTFCEVSIDCRVGDRHDSCM